MPPVPAYIPLPKAKEMFALSSWRDSPGLHGGNSAAGQSIVNNNNHNPNCVQPSPLMSNTPDAIRGSGAPSMSPSLGPAGLPPPHRQPMSPEPDLSTGTANTDDNNGQQRKQKSTSRGGRKQRGGKGHGGGQGNAQQPLDVDDFFVHTFLPPGVAFQTVAFELQAQATPLRTVDVGLPTVLFPRRAKDSQDAASATTATTAATGTDEEGKGGISAATGPARRLGGAVVPKSAIQLSPFATPALCVASTPAPAGAGTAAAGVVDDDGMLPPAMILPPAEHCAEESSGTSKASTPDARAKAAAAATNANATGNAASAAAVTATPGGSESLPQVSVLFAERDEAERTAAFVKKRWPTAHVSVVPRNRSLLNASLVLKGLPNMNKTEYILEELENLPFRPSYVRVHRGERGVYKNVVFVKYANREAAEDSKLRLERIFVGTRPLKVEFKKKSKPPASDATIVGSAVGHGNTNNTIGNTVVVNGGAEEDDGVGVTGASQLHLQQMVRDLRVSTEHEGFAYNRDDLAKGELKLLKQLCQSYGLLFDMTDTKVTVKRSLGGNLVPGMQGGSGSTCPSPALRPHQPPATPAWTPATPAPLRPMDFKGISHWKNISGQQNTLGIVRPRGPDDGGQAFPAGRGRPI